MFLKRLARYAITLVRGLVYGYVHRILLPLVLSIGFLLGLATGLVFLLVLDRTLYWSAGGGLVVAVLTVVILSRFVITRMLGKLERRIRP